MNRWPFSISKVTGMKVRMFEMVSAGWYEEGGVVVSFVDEDELSSKDEPESLAMRKKMVRRR